MKKLNTKTRPIVAALAFTLFFLSAVSSAVQAQTNTFTYQGRLTDTTVAQPTNATYTMTFRLFNAETGGTQIGADTTSAVSVINNLFTVKLNFGATAFNTTGARYLEIQVGNTILTPRQEITAAPFANRAVNAGSADALSSACVGCVTNAQINSVAGTKITGSVANADSATTAQNVSGVVAIANGGTGSSTKNFVDTTTAQTNIGGNKTFNNTVSANTFSGGTGGLNMNGNLIRLRDSADSNHGMVYSSVADGPEFRGFSGFRWTTGTNGATQRMSLTNSGNLTVTGNITANGTINGTLANNSVGSAQVADGSLRLADTSVFGGTASFGPITIPAHECAGFNINLSSGTIAIGDILHFYPSNITPAGFYIQPTITTSLTTNPFYICNTMNTSNTFPAQTIRYNFVRP